MSIIINLTVDERRICAWVGKMRYEHAMAAKRDPGQGPSADWKGSDNHIRGAECEFAASIMLNLYWRPTIGRINARDVGGLVEVRSTVLPRGCLIVKPKEDGPFVLVVKQDDFSFRFGGWMFAEDAQRCWPLKTEHGDPAHFVPQSSLDALSNLKRWLRDEEAR